MKMLARRKSDPSPRSVRIPARQSADAQFTALLRRKCLRAASIGALTAASESIPGLRRASRLVFGELLDAAFLTAVQRELIDDTFALYGLKMSAALQSTLVHKVQVLGTGASATSDALMRGLLRRAVGRAGSVVARRLLPITAIVSSAMANATVTYAIGKRAQAVARSGVTRMPDVVRAFTGVDERRIVAWTLTAVKNSLGILGTRLGKITASRWRSKSTPAQ